MKSAYIVSFLMIALISAAQDPACLQRQLAKDGKWTKLKETVSSTGSVLAIQRKFYDAVHNPLMKAYQPKGVDAAYSGSFQPARYDQPVGVCWYTVFAERYFCKGDGLELNKFDINTIFNVGFNHVGFLEIYDTTAADNPVGFRPLREGFPLEIRPGIWKFDDIRTSLGAGNEGLTKTWLITYKGELPWSFVSRKEFLQKRKRFLQMEMNGQASRLKDQLAGWEAMKKAKEAEYKSDATRLASFISGTYQPAIDREHSNYKKLMTGYENALLRIESQLAAPAEELNKPAIVIPSTENGYDYSFTDKMEPFAELLTRPNKAYFRKGLGAGVPQMITVTIKYDPKDEVSAGFAKEMEKNLSLDYLSQFIGKSSPGSSANTVIQVSSPVQAKAASGVAPGKVVNNNSGFFSGSLSAPAGVAVTLSVNGACDYNVNAGAIKDRLYNTSGIKFGSAGKDDQPFRVAVKKLPAGLKAVVYEGSGRGAKGADRIKIGVDYAYELVTRSTNDKVFSSFYESFSPVIGGMNANEGRYVVFVSGAKGFEGSDGKFRQVFWRDRNTGITRMISSSPSGEQGNGNCAGPSISADGQVVVFESMANNLVAGDNNGFKDVFLWRASTNTIELVSRGTGGRAVDADCFDAAISGDGKSVVFTSAASNLTIVPKGRSVANVFLCDMTSSKIELISMDPLQKTGGNGFKASISFDGSRVSFCSSSPTLVANDNNGLWDIFLWQKGQASLKRISLTHDGKERNGGTEAASRQVASVISGNGKFVSFATTASNMVPGDNNNFQDVFVVDVETGKVSAASFTTDGQASNGDSPIEQGEQVAISYDGTWVAFPTKATNLGAPGSNIILYNTVTQQKFAVTEVRGSYVGRPAMSYTGGYVLFGKSANLDDRYSSSGVFCHFTGFGACRQ